MARPKTYSDETLVCVSGKDARSKLQEGSERRAIINLIVDSGGSMTIKQLCDSFGYDIRAKAISLIKIGWLEVKEK